MARKIRKKMIQKAAKKKTSKTSKLAVFLVFLSTFLTSSGQLFIKLGVDKIDASFLLSVLNASLIFGYVLYSLAFVLLLISLKRGELSVLYPIIALGYIWTVVFSYFFLGEIINIFKVLGVIVIFLGVTLIGLGANK